MEERKSRGRAFKFAVGLLVLLALVDVALWGLVAHAAWQFDQYYRTVYTEFLRQRDLWEAQNIATYSLRFSNPTAFSGGFANPAPFSSGSTNPTSPVSCKNALLKVKNSIRVSLSPDCDSQSYQELGRALTVDEIYNWLDGQFVYGNWNWKKLEIEYDPEMHYVTRIVYEPRWGSPEEALYTDLLEE